MPAPFRGRGSTFNPVSRFLKQEYAAEHIEALDEEFLGDEKTQYIPEHAKKIVNPVESPDIPLPYSMNPYQGCEHGCIYCYARNTHAYWGLSAGLDFERKIIIKENAAELLREAFMKKSWEPAPIMFAGNTDCYQPVEREKQFTRKMLGVLSEFGNPVGMITKNSLILRDLDILTELAARELVHVVISLTTLDEDLRRAMEPRTSTAKNRLQTIAALSDAGVPVTVLTAPIIPGLNSHEIPALLEAAADAGALSAGYTMVRLNGEIGKLFEDWLEAHYPDRKDKVIKQIAEVHGGQVNDNRFGKRMRGEGPVADSIRKLFRIHREKNFAGRSVPAFNLNAFHRPGEQFSLF